MEDGDPEGRRRPLLIDEGRRRRERCASTSWTPCGIAGGLTIVLFGCMVLVSLTGCEAEYPEDESDSRFTPFRTPMMRGTTYGYSMVHMVAREQNVTNCYVCSIFPASSGPIKLYGVPLNESETQLYASVCGNGCSRKDCNTTTNNSTSNSTCLVCEPFPNHWQAPGCQDRCTG